MAVEGDPTQPPSGLRLRITPDMLTEKDIEDWYRKQADYETRIARLEADLRDERRPWFDINELAAQWHEAGRVGEFGHSVRWDGLCLPCGIIHWKPGHEPVVPGEKTMRIAFLHPDVAYTDERSIHLTVSVEWRGPLMAHEEWAVTRPGRQILGYGGRWDSEAGDHTDLWYTTHRFPLPEARRLAYRAANDLYQAWKARTDRAEVAIRRAAQGLPDTGVTR